MKKTYTYYGNGSLKTKVDRNGVVAEYIYDIFGRKIEEKVGDSVVKYTYDNNGNQLSKVETIYVDSVVAYEGITTYSYDVYNQLIEINTASGVHETYTYNSEGYRDSKTSNDKVIRYLYEDDKVILEVDVYLLP